MSPLNPITINGDTIAPPSTVREYRKHQKTRTRTLSGRGQENWRRSWNAVDLEWKYLTPAQQQQLLDLFEGGDTVEYANAHSSRTGGSLSFTGHVDFEEQEYYRGSSLLKKWVATIEEA